MASAQVDRVLDLYPRIYLACHTRHVRDPRTGDTLSRHQASVLSHLDDVDPTSMTVLAAHLGVTVSTMSLSITRLERGGYVTRVRSVADARVVELRLTDAGVRVRDAQTVLDRQRVAALLELVDGAQRAEAMHGLQLLADAADRLVREQKRRAAG